MNPSNPPTNPSPPVNRAMAWLRVILCILPSGFAVFSLWGQSWLMSHGYMRSFSGIALLVVNVMFVFGAGVYNAMLSTRARSETKGISKRTTRFLFIQLIYVPILWASLLFLTCAIFPPKM